MKSYKEYSEEFIGASDIASLTLRSWDKVGILNFGEDGYYQAYFVDDNAEIGSHYKEVFRCTGWLKIFDDDCMSRSFTGKEIIVYRAAEMGCKVQVLKN